MLAIQQSRKKPQQCTPNLLPARLYHNGPISTSEPYWNPTSSNTSTTTTTTTSTSDDTDSTTPTAYFRGRRLLGTPLSLPSNYEGAILHITDKDLPSSNPNISANGDDERMDDEEERENQRVEVKVAEKVGTFDEVVVWEHGSLVGGSEDCYVRGLDEWVEFAESMHVEEE
ncbi:ribonuclease H1 small subunit, partial [Zopfia rhizophila CBS 207.26]